MGYLSAASLFDCSGFLAVDEEGDGPGWKKALVLETSSAILLSYLRAQTRPQRHLRLWIQISLH